MSDLPIFVLNSNIIAAHTLGSDYTSAVLEVKEAKHFCVQPIAAGSSKLGAVQLQGSNDGVNFGNLGASIAVASANLVPVNYADQAVAYLRVVFTAAGGSGTLDVYISAKR